MQKKELAAQRLTAKLFKHLIMLSNALVGHFALTSYNAQMLLSVLARQGRKRMRRRRGARREDEAGAECGRCEGIDIDLVLKKSRTVEAQSECSRPGSSVY